MWSSLCHDHHSQNTKTTNKHRTEEWTVRLKGGKLQETKTIQEKDGDLLTMTVALGMQGKGHYWIHFQFARASD